MRIIITDKIKKIYPNASLGILAIRGVCNPNQHEELGRHKLLLENGLREKFSGLSKADLKNMEPIKSYRNYYKRFRKTYHVQLQLESIVFKNKSIPHVAALVEVMFMAELKNLLLTAGHDLDALELPIKLDAADGTEKYGLLNGQEKELLPGDMFISDSTGIMSSIIYGPDLRTRITPDTKNVLFTIYAPAGIEKSKVSQHLRDIKDYARMIAPDSVIELQKVFDWKTF